MIVKIIIIFIVIFTGIVFVFADAPPVLIYELYRTLFIFTKEKEIVIWRDDIRRHLKFPTVIFHFIFRSYGLI